ncbi:SDR family oxidoreductase [Verrucosispora sp. WMMD573]|uniref:SDR family NAD(P)-dependent oxidoreductase n=1 Tax=Verrucosispora sp. WMMD573 TaxID=3015149 RepID=UPI00248B9431|nr:SDR family oxidoreductase [Verrucosispora sp. WMMD573]WBB56654.1 SDR family NAD(P)-dependent oxidoreductase [Verrucosispora sp. WMMD573]
MRSVIISGASSGIGWATAQRFASGGDRVINLDVGPPTVPHHPAVTWIEADVADWSATRAAVRQVAETGPIDVVIANAGVSVRHGVLELTEADARRVVDVNLLGVLGLWQAAARVMVQQQAGVLLATASVNGARGYPFYADYNATKAGIVALCRTFALELSPWIRVACVSPGAVLTPMQLAEYTPAMLDDVNAKIPAGRHAAPDEIAAAFHYLASAEASFLTGQELVIDGAETAGATTAVFGTGTKVEAVA